MRNPRVCKLVDGFGQPHVHSGLGIRKFGVSFLNAGAIAIYGICFKTDVRSFTFAFLGTTTRLGPWYGEEVIEEM